LPPGLEAGRREEAARLALLHQHLRKQNKKIFLERLFYIDLPLKSPPRYSKSRNAS